MLHQSAPKPARVASNHQERYPLLSGSPSAIANLQQKPLSRYPSSHKIQRKQISASSLRDTSAHALVADGLEDESINRTTEHAPSDSKPPSAQPKAADRLSAGAAAVEKSSTEVKSIKEPRQTRTSSLRARISAGQVIRDSPNKVLGFTDFTAEKAPSTKACKEDLGSNAGFRARSSSSFSKAFTKKPSREEVGGSRAPAQFVAGSRRPSARRPSSRNSLRNDSRAPSPAFLEPSRPAPPIPSAKAVTSSRKSSIPIPRNANTTVIAKDASRSSSANGPTTHQPEVGKEVPHDSVALKKKPNEATEEHESDALVKGFSDENSYLESIAESPQSTFRSKCLSTKSSTYGPKLKISPSANRIIFGEGEPDKEKSPLVKKKKSLDLFRAAITNEYKNVTKGKAVNNGHKRISNRPLSSQGFSEDRPRDILSACAARRKKVKSVDLGSVSSTIEAKSESTTTAREYEESLKHESSPAVEDPFFEIKNQPGTRTEAAAQAGKSEAADEAPGGACITPADTTVENSVIPASDTITVVPAFLPETLQEHVNKSSDVVEPARVDEAKGRKAGSGALNLTAHLHKAPKQSSPSTPQQVTRSNGSPSSGSFPPRSSSRMNHPDYTINGSAKSSSVSSIERAAARLQKEISAAQAVEAKLADGEVPHQLSDTDLGLPRREIASQTILADVGSKRDSTARESTRSQTSVSKGLISNFRGLFHKRMSDNAEAHNARSAEKGDKRATVTAHGSPSPFMSNIHPVHRPTQASINRNGATAQRPCTRDHFSPGTSAVASPMPSEVSTTTTIAMEILESARRESSSPKKERLLELGKLMVDTITQARDAEKAMEEARHAARKAEFAHALCKKSVSDVAALVKDWRSDMARL